MLIYLLKFVFAATYVDASSPTLDIIEKHTVRVPEISGMCWRNDPTTGKPALVMVGDGSHKLYIMDWGSRANAVLKEIDVGKIDNRFAKGKSEWESVYADASGRVFILKENPTRILVISPDLKKIEADLDLLIPIDKANEVSWQDANSGGEGILPLKNGHFLVIKEKRPLRILEFAPPGDMAEGYNADLSIEFAGSFPLPKQIPNAFHLVHMWKLDAANEQALGDSSGINVDKDGVLYLLSDEGNRIVRLGSKLGLNQLLTVDQTWHLPKSIVQPEGMVIDTDNRLIVAIDNKKTKNPNLFVLSPPAAKSVAR